MGALLIKKVDRSRAFPGAMHRRRPRVLHLITSFDIGGTERQAVELLNRLDLDRFDVRLAVLRNGGELYPQIAGRFPNPPEFRLNNFYDANALRQLSRFRSLLVRERIDVLHAHDFYAGVFGCAAARLTVVRSIACQRHLRLSDRRAHEFLQRQIHRMAHKVLVNSEAIRDHILAGGGISPEKIVVIRNGLLMAAEPEDANSVRDELLRELKLDRESFLIGLVARLEEVKGHRYFLEAAAQVARKHPKVHFVLVGDGQLRGQIEQQAASLGISNRLHLLGYRNDASRLAAAFDLAVLSSLHEGLPNSVMEAMSAGVPVVATAVGGTKELVSDGETGYLVPPANADAMAERMTWAIEHNSERERLAAQGRQSVQTNFGMSQMVSAVERLYESLVPEKTELRESA